MGIRIECDHPKHPGVYVVFRETGWRFGDRTAILSSGSSDEDAVRIIVKYVEDWNVVQLDGAPAPRTDKGVAEADDAVACWLIRAWFSARTKAVAVSPN